MQMKQPLQQFRYQAIGKQLLGIDISGQIIKVCSSLPTSISITIRTIVNNKKSFSICTSSDQRYQGQNNEQAGDARISQQDSGCQIMYLKNETQTHQKSSKSDILSKVAQLVKKLQHKELPHKMIEATVLSRKTSVPQNTKLQIQQEHIVKQITITQRMKPKANVCKSHHELYNIEISRKSPSSRKSPGSKDRQKSDDAVEAKQIHPRLPQIQSHKTFSRSSKNMVPAQKNIIISYQTNSVGNNSAILIGNVANNAAINVSTEPKIILKTSNYNNVNSLLQTTSQGAKISIQSDFERKSQNTVSQLQLPQQKPIVKRLPIPDQSSLSLSGWTDRSPNN